jgi:hypothetical protein
MDHVVLRKGEWKIKHHKRHSHPYETQADAISSAIDAAHDAHREGGLFQVLVQGQRSSVPHRVDLGRRSIPATRLSEVPERTKSR